MPWKWQGNSDIFKVKELSGNYVMCQKRMKFCKNIREMSRNFTSHSDKIEIFGHDVAFVLNL